MVREGVFGTLTSLLDGLEGRHVLDLYAGSGAIGLEAWSRGAARVVLVESAKGALRALRDNVARLAAGSPDVQVVATKVETAAATVAPPAFDVVYADPPYDLPAPRLSAVLQDLAAAGLLAAGAVVAVERRARDTWIWPPGIEPVRDRRYGDTRVWYGLWYFHQPVDQATGGGMPVRRAVCPGSFDPVTNGHLDIVARAAELYDEVTVAVLTNITKTSMFSTEERVEMLRETTEQYGNVTVESFHGLLVDFCKEHGVGVIVKSLRSVSDFEYELQMAQMNKGQGDVDTVFLVTNPLYSFLSSSLVKEFATYGGDVSGLVPEAVLHRLTERIGRRAGTPR